VSEAPAIETETMDDPASAAPAAPRT
jgi:hypothetical protein